MSESALAGEVVSYLVQRYPGASAFSALWTWSGGAEADLPLEGSAQALWEQGWERAEEASGTSQVALVREALYDELGHPLLLDFLHERATASEPERLHDAALLLEWLERSASVAEASTASLAPLLNAFPPGAGWSEAFACLAPACEEWLTDATREALARAAQALQTRARVGLAAFDLRDSLREIDDEEAAEKGVAEARERVKELLREAEAGLPEDDLLRRELGRLVNRFAFRANLTLKATLAGLTSLLTRAKLTRKELKTGALAEALRSALWATNPLPPPEQEDDFALPEDDPEDEDDDEA